MKRPAFDAVLAARLSRRTVVTSAAATVGLAACAHVPTQRSDAARAPAFKSIAPQRNDAFTIADGYRYNVVARWGDSLVTGTADFDTSRLAADAWLDADSVGTQERQFGTNADAVAYFAQKAGRAARGLVCVNH